MSNSNFQTDLANESIIKEIIIEYLRKLEDVELEISSRAEDAHGSDIKMKSRKIFKDEKIHHLDLKSATNYRKVVGEKSLPTFAFELQFSNRSSDLRDGWLYGEQYCLTEYYLLSWVWVLDKEKTKPWEKLEKSDVAEIEVIIIPKKT
ncbi:hypothetical protein ACVRWQ_07530 [Streptococcus phocae subsp. salmonis]|uniref:hypothetical protein n=1 Tax=Streptococcus phocae TaxID=119224 RepID=UPI000531C2D8|nr:hypothetical protein [Streptococcus phocae]KGR73178.1 hypothetical protein NX86_01945 [Streptococcus phocae subsp. salmonis]